MISEEEIGKIVSGLAKKERVVIAEAMSKSKQGQTSKGKVPLNHLLWMTYKMSAGDATKVLKAEGIFPCSECRWAKLPYRLDDFHINAQCHSPKNKQSK